VKSRVRIIGNSREPAQRSRKLKKGKLRRGVKQTPVFIPLYWVDCFPVSGFFDSTHPSPTDIRAAGTFSARRPCPSSHDLSPPPRSAKKNSGVARRPLKLRFDYH
jgi:hypothetical protein